MEKMNSLEKRIEGEIVRRIEEERKTKEKIIRLDKSTGLGGGEQEAERTDEEVGGEN